MTTIVFPAIVETIAQAGYQATFPDLPGCVAHGASMGELLGDARARLSTALKTLADQGESWPEASGIEQARAAAAGGVVLLIDIEVDDPPTRVNISIGEQLLKRIDAAAQSSGMTRSGFLAQAARRALGENAFRSNLDWDVTGKRIQEELSSLGKKLNEALGPESVFSRGVVDLDQRVFDRIQKAADSVSSAMAKRKTQGSTTREDLHA